MLQKVRKYCKNVKNIKNGMRNKNFEKTAGKRKVREYILQMRIQITRKHTITPYHDATCTEV